ncbi:MAG: AAA family ATPase [Candidatus Wallbacteria bacterium]|nr:AAA family ATPase [Candidatus Wallbacteria bacterium]
MKCAPFLQRVQIRNFKAIINSKSIALSPLTVFIGNNGSGKSSFIESLETYRSIVAEGLDSAISRWYGFEHVWNKQSKHKEKTDGLHEGPLKFQWSGKIAGKNAKTEMVIDTKPGFNGQFILKESADWANLFSLNRENDGRFTLKTSFGNNNGKVDLGQSALSGDIRNFVLSWQFLNFTPDLMGIPTQKKMTVEGRLLLNRDGSNIAQYLAYIREKNVVVFNGIVETMRFVLDYSQDFQPVETSEIQRAMYIRMKEKEYDIPGWMLSTGTIRILALLAVLRNPEPSPVIFIEEIENGLDPRTMHLVYDEIRAATKSGKTQIVTTTHSPYFLDLLPLQTIILTERKNGESPNFWRPAEEKEILDWTKDFSPGELYSHGRFNKGALK